MPEPARARPRSKAPNRTAPRMATLIPAALVAITGCSEGGSGPDDWVTVEDSAGVRIVQSQADIPIEDPPIRVAAEPTVRIGSVAADDPALEFTYVPAATRLSDGRIVVIDQQAAEVRWFDSAGRPLTTRGGRGGGPSEFNSPADLLRLPGDSILVEDRPSMRHVIFGPEGEFVRSESFDREGFSAIGPRAECLSALLPDRSAISCRPEPGYERTGPDPGPGHLREYSRYVRTARDLSHEDTLGLYGGIEQWGIERADQPTWFAMHPFHAHSVLGVGGDPVRIASALNPEYSIEIWTPDGVLERIIRRPGAEVRPDPDDLAAARDQMREWVRDEQLLNRVLAEMDLPEIIPAIRRLTFGPGGELWVLRDAHSAPEGRDRYDVFDADGGLVAEVDLPEGTLVHEVGEDYLLAVRMDDLRVPYVELFEIER